MTSETARDFFCTEFHAEFYVNKPGSFLLESLDKHNKGYVWYIAIGLQAVDGLTTSKYLQDTAVANIEGKITIDEAEKLISS